MGARPDREGQSPFLEVKCRRAVVLAGPGRCGAFAQDLDHLVGLGNKVAYFRIVPLNPPGQRLGVDRHKVRVRLPDEERALGPQHVLLPEHLAQVVPRDGLERLVNITYLT